MAYDDNVSDWSINASTDRSTDDDEDSGDASPCFHYIVGLDPDSESISDEAVTARREAILVRLK